mgnify:CR=1 FL=1
MSVSSEHGRRVFALQVAGLEYRYHSNTPPTTSSLDSNVATSIPYVDSEGIMGVSTFSASIDPSGGIADYSAVTITLQINRRGGVGDPGIIFGRCGARSASTKAQLSQSLNRTGSIARTSSSLTSLSYPRLLHIGAETIRASSATSTTVLISARGVAGSARQTHSVGLEGSFAPELSAEITTFRGRRAKLFMAHRFPNGNTSNYVEVVNGFISESPYVEEGDTVSISLLPLTALIDTSLSDKGIGQTRLLQGYHYYDGIHGSSLEYALGLTFAQQNLSNLQVTPDTSGTITASTFSVIVENLQGSSSYLADFDTSLPEGPESDEFPREHPRFPKFRRSQDSRFDNDGVFTSTLTYNSSLPGYDVTADNTPSNALNASEISAAESLQIRLPLVELKQHQLGNEEVKEWPDVVNDTLINSGPSSTSGVAGGFARWRLTPDNLIRAEKLSESPFTAQLYLWPNFGGFSILREALERFGVSQPLKWGTYGVSQPLNSIARLSYPLSFTSGDTPVIQTLGDQAPTEYFTLNMASAEATAGQQIRELPRAYYQQFEGAILVESTLGLPTTATAGEFYYITVVFYDWDLDETRHQVFKVTHESTALFGGSNVGVLLHLADDHRHLDTLSFGDWPDKDRALLFRGGDLEDERPGVALLKILQSGGGDGINGTYDVMNIGLNIPSANIDEDSFLSVDTASTLVMSGNIFGDGADLRSMIDSLLKTLGAVLVMKRDESTGDSKLSLVAVGNEKTSQSTTTINAGDWLASTPPTWGIYEDIVTQIEYNYEYDPAEDKLTSQTIFNNQEAISRYGDERSKISLELPGVTSRSFGRNAGDVFNYFLPTSSRLFNLLSNPLRTWSGSIGTGPSIFLDVGSYVQVSSPHLRGYSDSYGVTDGVGMIRAISQELMTEGCQLELITTGLSPVNWNSSARVSAISSTTSVTVNANDFSGSSLSDASFFQADDVVDYVPKGDHDSAITNLTILSVAGNLITFTSSHGISSAGGTIEPTTFANASTIHQEDAYLADSSDRLAVSTDAQEYN